MKGIPKGVPFYLEFGIWDLGFGNRKAIHILCKPLQNLCAA
jgi:hypothetical protein